MDYRPFGLLDMTPGFPAGGVTGRTPSGADDLGRLLYSMTGAGGAQDAAGLLGGPSVRENLRSGNNFDAGLQMLAALPVVGMLGTAGKVARGAQDAAKAAEEAQGIIAYHGSPHSFDKFDLSKIGTGEGAQAYGHGLYFAESEPVAKSYRDALKPGYFNNVLTIDGRDFGSDMGNYYLRNAVEKAVPSPGAGFASGKETFDFYNKEMSDAVYKALLKAETGHDVNSVAAGTVDAVLKKNAPYEDEAAAVDEIRRALLGHIQDNVTSRPNGSMYQVRINADPNAFLDWDKPLSEQSPVVQQALRNRYGGYLEKIFHPSSTGEDVARRIENTTHANEMAQAGLPGIKYLDQGSRVTSGGELLDVFKGPNGWQSRIKVSGRGGAGFSTPTDSITTSKPFASEAEARAWADSKINSGSRNYVVFDDSLIDILKKYGLIGLLGGGAAASGVSGMNTPPAMPNSAPGL